MADRKMKIGVKLLINVRADDDVTLETIMENLDCITDTDKADIEDVEVIDYECQDSR